MKQVFMIDEFLWSIRRRWNGGTVGCSDQMGTPWRIYKTRSGNGVSTAGGGETCVTGERMNQWESRRDDASGGDSAWVHERVAYELERGNLVWKRGSQFCVAADS